MFLTILLEPNSAGQITSPSTTSYVPAGAAATILSCNASYATSVLLTLMLGLAFSNAAVIPARSDAL